MLNLAFELGKFPHEIEALPISDFDDLLRFKKIQQKWQDKANKKARKKR